MDDRKVPKSPWEGVKFNPRQLYYRSLWYLLVAALLVVQSFRMFDRLPATALSSVFLLIAALNIAFRHKRRKVYEAALKAEEEARRRALSEAE